MTVAVSCPECSADVAFEFDGPVRNPTQACPDCGVAYRLTVTKLG